MKKWIFSLLFLVSLFLMAYGGSRIYYAYTDGFQLSNIADTTSFTKTWDTRSPTKDETALATNILQQKFTYLGKGCQSYVFLSEDGQYVLKFIKYQRFQTKPWLDVLAFIPYFHQYREERLSVKKEKLFMLLTGWQTAFNHLPQETGVVWVHLNAKTGLSYPITIVDKIGSSHSIDLRDYQYLVQRKVEMIDVYLQKLFEHQELDKAQAMMDKLIAMILGIYQQGFADNDPALIQNTGVAHDMPLPIDMGQLVQNNAAKDESVYKQALFNKTYRLREWLSPRSPETLLYLEQKLRATIGEEFATMTPDQGV